VTKGERALEGRDFKVAIRDFTGALSFQESPAYRFRALLGRSRAFEEVLDYQLAMEDLNELINLYPESYAARFRRGVLLFRLKDFTGAIGDFTIANRLNGGRVVCLRNRGMAFEAIRDLDQAEGDYTKAISVIETNGVELDKYGSHGRLPPDRRKEIYEVKLEDEESDAQEEESGVLFNRATVRLEKKNGEGALADLEKFEAILEERRKRLSNTLNTPQQAFEQLYSIRARVFFMMGLGWEMQKEHDKQCYCLTRCVEFYEFILRPDESVHYRLSVVSLASTGRSAREEKEEVDEDLGRILPRKDAGSNGSLDADEHTNGGILCSFEGVDPHDLKSINTVEEKARYILALRNHASACIRAGLFKHGKKDFLCLIKFEEEKRDSVAELRRGQSSAIVRSRTRPQMVKKTTRMNLLQNRKRRTEEKMIEIEMASLLFGLGVCDHQLGFYSDAMQSLDACISKNRSLWAAYFRRALVSIEANLPIKKAVQDFATYCGCHLRSSSSRVPLTDKSSLQATVLLVEWTSEDPGPSGESRIDDRNFEPCLHSGVALAEIGEYSYSLLFLNKSFDRCDEECDDVLVFRAMVLMKLERYDAAYRDIEDAISRTNQREYSTNLDFIHSMVMQTPKEKWTHEHVMVWLSHLQVHLNRLGEQDGLKFVETIDVLRRHRSMNGSTLAEMNVESFVKLGIPISWTNHILFFRRELIQTWETSSRTRPGLSSQMSFRTLRRQGGLRVPVIEKPMPFDAGLLSERPLLMRGDSRFRLASKRESRYVEWVMGKDVKSMMEQDDSHWNMVAPSAKRT
jgi:tetratricopeptide (TPR) repeat protein